MALPNPTGLEGLLEQARQNYTQANAYPPNRTALLEESVRLYSKVLEIDPENIDAYFFRGSVYIPLGEFDKAISDLTQVMIYDSTQATNLTPEDSKMGNARDIFARDIILYRIHATYINMINAFNRMGKFSEAAEIAGKAIEFDPKDEHAYAMLGDSMLGAGNNSEAETNYQRALEEVNSSLKFMEQMGALHDKIPMSSIFRAAIRAQAGLRKLGINIKDDYLNVALGNTILIQQEIDEIIAPDHKKIEEMVYASLKGQDIAYDPSSQESHGLLAQDAKGALVYYDKGAERIFGYRRNEAIGMPSASLVPNNHTSDEYTRARQALFDRVIGTGIPETISETQRITKSGDVINIQAVVFRYALPNGKYSIAALVNKVS